MTTHTGNRNEMLNKVHEYLCSCFAVILFLYFAIFVSFRQYTYRRGCQLGESKYWHDRLLCGSLRGWWLGWDNQTTVGKPHCSELQRQDSVDTQFLSAGHVSIYLSLGLCERARGSDFSVCLYNYTWIALIVLPDIATNLSNIPLLVSKGQVTCPWIKP